MVLREFGLLLPWEIAASVTAAADRKLTAVTPVESQAEPQCGIQRDADVHVANEVELKPAQSQKPDPIRNQGRLAIGNVVRFENRAKTLAGSVKERPAVVETVEEEDAASTRLTPYL